MGLVIHGQRSQEDREIHQSASRFSGLDLKFERNNAVHYVLEEGVQQMSVQSRPVINLSEDFGLLGLKYSNSRKSPRIGQQSL